MHKGTVNKSGGHRTPAADKKARIRITKYHSGIKVMEKIEFDNGWYKDWNGAVPHIP
jgi:hypothetical protein